MTETPKTTDPIILRIGEPGDEVVGWAAEGEHNFLVMRRAIEHYSGDRITKHHVIATMKMRLECFNCGPIHRTHSGHLKSCDNGDDDWHWNMNAGRVHTLVMADGRSPFLHFGQVLPRE